MEALRSIRRWARANGRLEGAVRALGQMVEARVRVELRRAQRGGRAPAFDDGVGVLLTGGDDVDGASGVLVEVEGPLATLLVARALKRRAPRVSTSQPPAPSVAGALGAILVAAARSSGAIIRLRAAGSGAEVRRETFAPDLDLDHVTLTVLTDDEAFLARVTLAGSRLGVVPDRWGRAGLATLGDAWMEIPIVAAASVASTADLASLAIGDAWMPEAWSLPSSGGGLAGPVWLAPADSERGVCADLGEDRRLVLRAGSVDLSWSADPKSSTRPQSTSNQDGPMDEHDTSPIVEAMGDVPIVVRVEIGTARMRAREWTSLEPGDVVALGGRVAEPVVLRVGGAEVARGELVDIDGQVGVRILSRTQAPGEDTPQ
jgi:flagellar motor switch/type III secretory pathway protein FliN